jgi:hypothetical protein
LYTRCRQCWTNDHYPLLCGYSFRHL